MISVLTLPRNLKVERKSYRVGGEPTFEQSLRGTHSLAAMGRAGPRPE